jgi:hypothetical protein
MRARPLGMFGPREANGMRQHDPTDLYLVGYVHLLGQIKPGHPASEYRGIATQVIFMLEAFADNEFNAKYLPNATKAIAQILVVLRPFLTTDWELDEAYVDKMLRQGAVSHFRIRSQH